MSRRDLVQRISATVTSPRGGLHDKQFDWWRPGERMVVAFRNFRPEVPKCWVHNPQFSGDVGPYRRPPHFRYKNKFNEPNIERTNSIQGIWCIHAGSSYGFRCAPGITLLTDLWPSTRFHIITRICKSVIRHATQYDDILLSSIVSSLKPIPNPGFRQVRVFAIRWSDQL